MRAFDRLLQTWRARRVRRWIPRGARVLDIGCHQGEFLRPLCAAGSIGPSVGIDPLATPVELPGLSLRAQLFGEPLSWAAGAFDVVVMLATLEHITDKAPLARECRRLLRPGGLVVITVPEPAVDGIVSLLTRLRILDGMSLEEHHGFRPADVVPIFAFSGFVLRYHARFQLGLNHLFVLAAPAG